MRQSACPPAEPSLPPRPTTHVPAACSLPSRSPVERAPTHAAADTTVTSEGAAKCTLVAVLARSALSPTLLFDDGWWSFVVEAHQEASLLVRQGPWIEDVHIAPLYSRVEHILQEVASRFGEPVEHQFLANAGQLSSVKHLLLLSSSLRAALDLDCWRWRTLCSSRWTFGTTRSSAVPLTASCAWPGTSRSSASPASSTSRTSSWSWPCAAALVSPCYLLR